MTISVNSFTPLSVPNLVVWLDDSGFFTDPGGTVPCVADGDPVGFWLDRSGNGNNAVALTYPALFGESPPLFGGVLFSGLLSPPGAWPGGPLPRYGVGRVGGHDCMTSDFLQYLTAAVAVPRPFSAFVVFRLQTTSGGSQDFFGTPSIRFGNLDQKLYISPSDQFASGGDNYAHVVRIAFGDGEATTSIDGGNPTTAATGADGFDAVNIGIFQGSNRDTEIQISEIVIVSGVVSDANAALLSNYLLNKYARSRFEDALLALKSTIVDSGLFPANAVSLSLVGEPYALNGGPFCLLVPGVQSYQPAAKRGDGRYYYLMNGGVTARIVDFSFRDMAMMDAYRMTRASTGLLRYAHRLADATQLRFLVDPNDVPICNLPIHISSMEQPRHYSRDRSAAWGYVDLQYDLSYDERIYPIVFDSTLSEPRPSELADVLIGIQSLVQSTQIFNSNQVLISLFDDIFPFSDPPFCSIKPGRFTPVAPDLMGAGRDYASYEGQVIITVVGWNFSDVVDRADYALAAFSPQLGLLSRVAALIDRLQLAMPTTPEGVPLTEDHIYAVRMSEPAYYKKSRNMCKIDIHFNVRYQQALA